MGDPLPIMCLLGFILMEPIVDDRVSPLFRSVIQCTIAHVMHERV